MAKRGRPRKNKDLLLNAKLIILLTSEQKALIEEAALLNQSDVATWVRPVILDAARARIAERAKRKK